MGAVVAVVLIEYVTHSKTETVTGVFYVDVKTCVDEMIDAVLQLLG